MNDPLATNEPAGFAGTLPRLSLEIRSVAPAGPEMLLVTLRIGNGTGFPISPAALAEWSRNVGWYATKDGDLDDLVSFEGHEDEVVPAGESRDFPVRIGSRSAIGEGRPPARLISIEYLHVDAAGKQTRVKAPEVDAPVAATASPAAPAIGPKSGCLGVLFGRLG